MKYKESFYWCDRPDEEYPKHYHLGEVRITMNFGEVTFCLENEEKVVKTGEILILPPKTIHSAKAGPQGACYYCEFENEGDDDGRVLVE